MMRGTICCRYCGEQIPTHWQIFKHITCCPPPQPEPAPESDPEPPAAPEPTPAPTTPEPASTLSPEEVERQLRRIRHRYWRFNQEVKRMIVRRGEVS
jgi:hypothetical protein